MVWRSDRLLQLLQPKPTHIHTLSKVKNAHFTPTHRLFCYNTVYFLICLILWCKCSVLLWCGAGGWRGSRGTPGWFRGGSVSVWASPPLSLFTSLCFLEGWRSPLLPFSGRAPDWKICGVKQKNAVLMELITSTFLTILCLCCRLNPDSFLVRQYNMCLVLAHMYIKCISVYTRAIHAIKQSITVTIIDNIHVSFFRVLAPFYFHFFPLLVPISCRCVQSLKKKGRWHLWLSLSYIWRVCGHFMKPFFITLTVMLWRWSWLSVLFFVSFLFFKVGLLFKLSGNSIKQFTNRLVHCPIPIYNIQTNISPFHIYLIIQTINSWSLMQRSHFWRYSVLIFSPS